MYNAVMIKHHLEHRSQHFYPVLLQINLKYCLKSSFVYQILQNHIIYFTKPTNFVEN